MRRVLCAMGYLGLLGQLGCSTTETVAPLPLADPLIEELGRCAEFDPERRPFFGDTHVHTVLSHDANLGGTRLSPADAYRFAQGHEVGVQPYGPDGESLQPLRLARPLDFMAVADHAEFIGLVHGCMNPDSAEYDHPICEDFRESPDGAVIAVSLPLANGQGTAARLPPCDLGCVESTMSAWQQILDAAEAAYDRTEACTFTSFVGYEWTGSPGARNLHRNVIFRNHIVPPQPTSYLDESFEEDLWRVLREQCIDADGICDAITIPHNSNLSSGLMFETVDDSGAPFDAEYAKTRAELEPLVEIYQHKGASECIPGATSGDELCGFEIVPYDNLQAATSEGNDPIEPREEDYLRSALGKGLQLGESLGVNPFEYGFIGSTDTHFASGGAVDERRFVGHGSLSRRDALPTGLQDLPWNSPGGLAVLWAEENSREALFAAMRRREAYATSGPRITLRFFGSWGYPIDLCNTNTLVSDGYKYGVPMGSVLPAMPDPVLVPSFAISAMRDPMSRQLQRIQIVKATIVAGEVNYTVLDVAGDPENGATVDTTTCQTEGEGANMLCTVWYDPAFDRQAPALYYARVVENPSCRWHTYRCNELGMDCSDLDQPPIVQERAWSSPIWYVP